MSRRLAPLALLVLGSAGCTSDAPAEATAALVAPTAEVSPVAEVTPAVAAPAHEVAHAHDPAAPEAHGRLPLRAQFSSGTAALPIASPLTLTLEVERLLPAELVVEVLPPAGVQVIEPAGGRLVLPPPTAPGIEQVAVTVSFGDIPADDLVVRVSGGEVDWGFHAEPTYRFGRPEPAVPTVTFDGPSLTFQGRDLGPSVQVPVGN